LHNPLQCSCGHAGRVGGEDEGQSSPSAEVIAKHPAKKGKVTIAGHPSAGVALQIKTMKYLIIYEKTETGSSA